MKGNNMLDLTENEIEILKSATCENGTFEYGFTYEIQVYNYSRVYGKTARGALASLVKKGILRHNRVREDGTLWNYYYGTDEYMEELNKQFGRNN